MVEDHNGYLWMGTHGGGLNRYDGRDFETFTVKKDQIINNDIAALYEINEKLYVGAKNGMSVYDGRKFKNYFVSKKENIAVKAFQWYNGELLVGTSRGVYTFDGSEFKYALRYNTSRPSSTNCFFIDTKKRLWIGTGKGAICMDGKGRSIFRSPDDFTRGTVSGICEDKKGRIWFSTFEGVFAFDGNSFSKMDKSDGLASKVFNDITCDQKGLIWMASQDNGISIFNPIDSTITAVNAETGLCNNNVKVILEDSWGSIWIATSGGAVCKYVGQQFLHLDISDRPADNLVYSLLQDTSGVMWFSSADDGIVRKDSSGLTRIGADKGFVNSKTKAMLRDSKGRLWFGTNKYGLSYFNGSSFEFLKYKNEPLGRFSKDIVEDEFGNIWLASSSEGVYKIFARDSIIQIEQPFIDTFYINDSLIVTADTLTKDSSVFTYRIYKIGEINSGINDLHFDLQGRLWFASSRNGIGYYNQNGVKTFGRNAGLPSNDVRSITEDGKGHLWIGTAGYGIARLSIYADSLDIRVFTENDDLSSDNIFLMEFDEKGDLWVGCGKGVDRISMNEDQTFKEVKSYGKDDGFLGVEACQNAVIKDQEGNLWFGTIAGVTKFLPGTKSINEKPPKLQVKSIELFSQPFEETAYKDWISSDNIFKAGLELPYHQNNLNFEFLGINLANPKKVEYQWMLEGSDKDWTKKSPRNNQGYSSLAPGAYTFKIRSYNEDGFYNDPPLQMNFTILPPIWQRWWFILGSVLLLATIIGLFFKRRLNQIRKKANEQQERLEMENNLLQLEQKALQLQMNPHFIFNALNTVQSLFMSNEQGAARTLLSKFAKLMRSILENSRAAEIPLQKEIDLLDNYLAIEQFSRPGKFQYKLEIDPSIDTEEVNIPPMMIQPFVENSIIHGVNHLKSEGLITLIFKKEENHLLCTVRDNGIGREASAKMKEQKARKHKSVALEVTKERLGFLNQKNDAKSLIFRDLNNDDGSAAGTEVLIRLPLEEW